MPEKTLTEQVAEVMKNIERNTELAIEYDRALIRFRKALDAFRIADAGKK